MAERLKFPLFFLVVLVVAVICYGPFLNSFFACDDFKYLENIIIGGPRQISLGYNAQMRLVSNWAWVPLYLASGIDPLGYNLFSLCLAIANAILLYRFLLQLVQRQDVAMTAAVIFIMSASGADAIFWKANFSGMLSLFFSLTALSLFLRYKESSSAKYYCLSLLSYLFAIFSKEDAASLVPLLFVIEMLFYDGRKNIRSVAARIAPFALVVLFFLASTSIAYHLLHVKSETWGWFKIRPLYALFGGFAAFFINPDGVLKMSDPRIYATALLVPASFFVLKEKKLLLFGYLWIVLTFIPSSFTSIGVFQPSSFTSSPSRFFYAPSAGVAMVMAFIAHSFAERMGKKKAYAAMALPLLLMMYVNTTRIHDRGESWARSAAHAERFLAALKRIAPELPQHSYLVIESPLKPVGWLWQAIIVTYRHGGIHGGWKFPERLEPGEALFLVRCDPATVLPYQVRKIM